MEIPEVNRGTLSIEEQRAVIRTPGQKDRVAGIIPGPYVDYDAALPTTWAIRATVATEALLKAVDLISDHLAPSHPTDLEGTHQCVPTVEVQLAVSEQSLSLVTTRSTSIPAQIETDGPEGVFRIGVNHTYLRDMVCALGLDPDEALELRFTDPLKAILFLPVRRADRKGLLMPLVMKDGIPGNPRGSASRGSRSRRGCLHAAQINRETGL
jgi:hypothetical protein